jgi:hypothetical protein
MEVWHGRQLDINCSFSLCHPASIDQVFEAWVLRIANRFRTKIVIADEVGPELPFEFPYPDYAGLREGLIPSIATARSQWRRMFGDEVAGLTAAEAVGRFILPHAKGTD